MRLEWHVDDLGEVGRGLGGKQGVTRRRPANVAEKRGGSGGENWRGGGIRLREGVVEPVVRGEIEVGVKPGLDGVLVVAVAVPVPVSVSVPVSVAVSVSVSVAISVSVTVSVSVHVSISISGVAVAVAVAVVDDVVVTVTIV